MTCETFKPNPYFLNLTFQSCTVVQNFAIQRTDNLFPPTGNFCSHRFAFCRPEWRSGRKEGGCEFTFELQRWDSLYLRSYFDCRRSAYSTRTDCLSRWRMASKIQLLVRRSQSSTLPRFGYPSR